VITWYLPNKKTYLLVFLFASVITGTLSPFVITGTLSPFVITGTLSLEICAEEKTIDVKSLQNFVASHVEQMLDETFFGGKH